MFNILQFTVCCQYLSYIQPLMCLQPQACQYYTLKEKTNSCLIKFATVAAPISHLNFSYFNPVYILFFTFKSHFVVFRSKQYSLLTDPAAEKPVLLVSMVEDVKDRGGSGYVIDRSRDLLSSYLADSAF